MFTPVARNVDPLETMPVSRHAGLQRWGLRGLFIFVMLFLYLPIVFMVAFSFDTSATPGLPIQGLTLHWYDVMLHNRQLLTAVQNTVTVSLIVAVLATIIARWRHSCWFEGAFAIRTRSASCSPCRSWCRAC